MFLASISFLPSHERFIFSGKGVHREGTRSAPSLYGPAHSFPRSYPKRHKEDHSTLIGSVQHSQPELEARVELRTAALVVKHLPLKEHGGREVLVRHAHHHDG